MPTVTKSWKQVHAAKNFLTEHDSIDIYVKIGAAHDKPEFPSLADDWTMEFINPRQRFHGKDFERRSCSIAVPAGLALQLHRR